MRPIKWKQMNSLNQCNSTGAAGLGDFLCLLHLNLIELSLSKESLQHMAIYPSDGLLHHFFRVTLIQDGLWPSAQEHLVSGCKMID